MTSQLADNKDCVSPSEVASSIAKSVMPKRVRYGLLKMFLLAIAAGAFVVFGVNYGVSKLENETSGENEEKLAIYPWIIAKKEVRDFLPSFL